MLPIAYYLLKVIVCSAILYGYYWLLLRNKVFHKYNRFYLMASVVLSLLLPLIKINFWQEDTAQQAGIIKVLQAVSQSDEYMDTIVVTANSNTTTFDATKLYTIAYLLVSLILLAILLHTLFVIFCLLKKYPKQIIDKISLINTEAKNTPFSFLNYIFWNNNIDIETTSGKQIFKHELAHVEEKHTYDKLFINIILIFFWCNPFFWLYRKELNMIHEFIADKKSVKNSDTAAFAAMILQATYPQHQFQLTNNFFYSPIKRRLFMLTKNKNPKVNYFGRVMVLPLLVIIFAAFTFKVKENKKQIINNNVAAEFHGNENIQLIKTVQPNDTPKTLQKIQLKATIDNNTYSISADSVVFYNSNKSSLEKTSDILVVLNGKKFDYKKYPNAKIIAKLIKSYGAKNKEAIKKYGIEAAKGLLEFYDAVIIENDPAKKLVLKSNSVNGKELIITDGKEIGYGTEAVSTIDENSIERINVLKGESAIAKYGDKGKNGVIEITTKTKSVELAEVLPVATSVNNLNAEIEEKQNQVKKLNEEIRIVKKKQLELQLKLLPVFSVGSLTGVRVDIDDFKKQTEIKVTDDFSFVSADVYFSGEGFINVNMVHLSGSSLQPIKSLIDRCVPGTVVTFDKIYASNLTGDKKEIGGKSYSLFKSSKDDTNIIFTKTEVNPSFSGGNKEWKKYLMKKLNGAIPADENWKPGIYTIIVQFIVHIDGSVSDVTTNDYLGSKTAQHCIDLIKNSPSWIAAIQNGKSVNAYWKQPINFVVQ